MNKIDKYLKTLAEEAPGRVLDIGAGDCEIASYFVGKGSKVDVLEPEPGENCINKGINLEKERIEDYALSSGTYDLVIMRSIIHFIEPDALFDNVLPKVEESLKGNGFLYILTMTPPEESSRFTHKPEDITDALDSLILCKKEENKRKMTVEEKEFNHTTWKLVYQKTQNNKCSIEF